MNSSKIFKLSNKERDMIEKHMWPVTIIPPKSIEGLLLTIVDKYCTIIEAIDYYYRVFLGKELYILLV